MQDKPIEWAIGENPYAAGFRDGLTAAARTQCLFCRKLTDPVYATIYGKLEPARKSDGRWTHRVTLNGTTREMECKAGALYELNRE